MQASNSDIKNLLFIFFIFLFLRNYFIFKSPHVKSLSFITCGISNQFVPFSTSFTLLFRFCFKQLSYCRARLHFLHSFGKSDKKSALIPFSCPYCIICFFVCQYFSKNLIWIIFLNKKSFIGDFSNKNFKDNYKPKTKNTAKIDKSFTKPLKL